MSTDAYGRFDPSGGTYWNGDKKYREGRKVKPAENTLPAYFMLKQASAEGVFEVQKLARGTGWVVYKLGDAASTIHTTEEIKQMIDSGHWAII